MINRQLTRLCEYPNRKVRDPFASAYGKEDRLRDGIPQPGGWGSLKSSPGSLVKVHRERSSTFRLGDSQDQFPRSCRLKGITNLQVVVFLRFRAGVRASSDSHENVTRKGSRVLSAFTLMCLMFLPCWKQHEQVSDKSLLLNPDSPEMNRRAPDRFKARVETSKGVMRLEIRREQSPQGVD